MLMMQPTALAISHDTKHAYIVDATAHRLRKMSLDWRDHTSGDVTLRSVPRDFHSTKSWHLLGGPSSANARHGSMPFATGNYPGQLKDPHGLTIDRDSMFAIIADSGNARLVSYNFFSKK